IAGIAITFYLPRRRIWARLAPDGALAIVARSDRYVDVEREFGRLLDDLVRRRGAAPGSQAQASRAAAVAHNRRVAPLESLGAAVLPSARWLTLGSEPAGSPA